MIMKLMEVHPLLATAYICIFIGMLCFTCYYNIVKYQKRIDINSQFEELREDIHAIESELRERQKISKPEIGEEVTLEGVSHMSFVGDEPIGNDTTRTVNYIFE